MAYHLQESLILGGFQRRELRSILVLAFEPVHRIYSYVWYKLSKTTILVLTQDLLGRLWEINLSTSYRVIGNIVRASHFGQLLQPRNLQTEPDVSTSSRSGCSMQLCKKIGWEINRQQLRMVSAVLNYADTRSDLWGGIWLLMVCTVALEC